LEVTQPIGTFYIASIPALDVLAISYADVRRIEARDIEKAVGIQRELSDKRLKELRQYVRNVDATFPTSIILSVSSKNVSYDAKKGLMRIKREDEVAKIIDGQHRIAGLEGFEETFDLNVTLFVDMDIEDEAMTFAVINLSQTKVNKSLVYDLYEFQSHRSPTKTCHNLARLLTTQPKSPFFNRIKILGKASGDEPFQFITQASFVESLTDYISPNPMEDRDRIRRGLKIESYGEKETYKYIFRDLFRRERDAAIGKIIWNYFDAVEQTWPTAWNSDERGVVLNRTTGFRGLMRFLGPVYRSVGGEGVLSQQAALEVFQRVRKKLRDSDFTVDEFKPGTSGEVELDRRLRENSGIE